MTTRSQLISTARTFLGTPFRHQGRRTGTGPGAGVDCVGLLICLGRECGFTDPAYDNRSYSHAPDPAFMRAELAKTLIEIPVAAARTADIVLMSMGSAAPTHVALLTDIGMLHAYAMRREVVEHGIDAEWRGQIRAAYSIPGLED